MQVVSGAMGKETVHFQAPAASNLQKEMAAFLEWFNASPNLDLVLKAAVAHLWFLTIHPFDDGNGRIGRAMSDMLLTRADGTNRRYYSMSAQIRKERKAYYTMLERTQKGSLDVTPWMLWFLQCLHKSVNAASLQLNEVMHRSRFWQQHQYTPLNVRQTLMVNKRTDGFRGKLTTAKWAKMCKCSHDTALRDVNDLVSKGVLRKEDSGGRSTSYTLAL
jgi:Fic family protein